MGPARFHWFTVSRHFPELSTKTGSYALSKFCKSVDLLDILSTENVPPTALEAEMFEEQDGKTSNWIIAFVYDDLLDLIGEKETAKEIWTTPANEYAKKSMASHALFR